MIKVGPTLVKSGLVYSMKNINTTTSFSLSPVSTKWYHPPSKHPHHYYVPPPKEWLLVPPSFLWHLRSLGASQTQAYMCHARVCVWKSHAHTQVLQCSKLHREQIFSLQSSIEWKLCPKMDFKMKTLHHPKKKKCVIYCRTMCTGLPLMRLFLPDLSC